jgi:hypothetical protein
LAQNTNAAASKMAEADSPPVALSRASEAEITTILEEQQALNQKIAQEPVLEPIVGPVTSKPAFLSETEWTVLTAMAQQQPSPDKALTGLVNATRFNKQLEHWEGLSQKAAADTRLGLARQLLDDLPQQVLEGNVDLHAATKLQSRLLVDAVQNPSERKRRAATEAKRLVPPPPDSAADKH